MADGRRVPGPWNFPGLGVWRQRDLLGFLVRVGDRYGDVWRFRVGGKDFYVLNHPELVRQVLVADAGRFIKGPAIRRAKITLGEGLLSSEGELHKRQRRLMTPVFHPSRVATYVGRMVGCGEAMCDGWKEGEVFDVHERMTGLTLDVVSRVLFGGEVGEEVGRIGGAMQVLVKMFDRARNPIGPVLNVLPLPSNLRFLKALREVEGMLQGFIEKRRRENIERSTLNVQCPRREEDLLGLLLAAQDGEGGMSDKQLRDEALTLFAAGHETTANALVWTWYLLALNPEVERAFHEEVDRVVGEGPLKEGDVEKLVYTRMVLAESMRLYPPAWVVAREVVGAYEIGGYPIKSGSVLLMSQYLLHRDGRFWEEPLRFDPGRFGEGKNAEQARRLHGERPKYAYFPFGGGPRSCIGEGFAWVEGVVLLATIARRWRLELLPGQEVRLHPTITLRPRDAMRMRLVRRGLVR